MIHDGKFLVKFRGIRGSHPTPSKDKLVYGGNTACVEVKVNGYLVVFDIGTGFISLGEDLFRNHIASGVSPESREAVNVIGLVSHTHADHIQGFPFFKPAYLSSTKINLFGPKSNGTDFKQTLSDYMLAKFFPVELDEIKAKLMITNIKENDVIVLHPDNENPQLITTNLLERPEVKEDAVIIECMKSYAHPSGVLIYKISFRGHSVVYATDKESYIGGDVKLSSFARNTDLLIHDAQYTADEYNSHIITKQGFGHSTPEMAIEVAKQAKAKKLVLFHIDPIYTDEVISEVEANLQKTHPNLFYAKENTEIEII